MNILIVGGGDIGLRHLNNVRNEEPDALVTLWHSSGNLPTVNNVTKGADNVVTNIEDALEANPDIALIACPTAFHVQVGLVLAREGVDLFIEKPLSNTMDGVEELLALCRKKDLVLMVGYNYRFYRPLEILKEVLHQGLVGRFVAIRAEVGQYLPDWRKRDYRQTVSARRELGGGVVMELSHELDYVRWLVGEEVRSVFAQVHHLSDLQIDVEDTADILMQFKNRTVGNVHMNMFQRAPSRTCQVVGTEGVIRWDGLTHEVRLYSTLNGVWENLYASADFDRNEMYRKELRHFLDCVREKSKPIVDGNDGCRVLEIALAIKKSSEQGCLIAV